jgi:hypothetical protein
MNRFKDTELGEFLINNFPDIADEVITLTSLNRLPDPEIIKESWKNTPGIEFSDRMKFEELMAFYPTDGCETKNDMMNDMIDPGRSIKFPTKEIGVIVLCLLASIGLAAFITKLIG